MSCWGLVGVKLSTVDGRTIEGYVPWNSVWLERPLAPTKRTLPDVIFELQKQAEPIVEHIRLYTQLHDIYLDKERTKRKVVTTAPSEKLAVKDITTMVLNPGPFDGYAGAGGIQQLSAQAARYLDQTPVAYCVTDTDYLADLYWVSYTDVVGPEEISVLCRPPWSRLIVETKHLERNGILRLVFAYD